MEANRIAANDAASGTRIIRSITWPTKLGSIRGRPIPSIREPLPVVQLASSWAQPSKNAEFSGSTTSTWVS